MRYLFLVLLLVGCNEGSSSSEKEGSSQTYIFGDDIAIALKLDGVVDKSRAFDGGSNGAMSAGQCQFMAYETYQPGDVVIMQAGYLDAIWYGPQDDGTIQHCTNAFAKAKSEGARVIIVTPITGPDAVYGVCLNVDACSPSNDNTSSVFYANLMKSIATDLGLEVIDLNSEFTPDVSKFTWIWPNETGLEEIRQIVLSHLE